MTAGFLQNDYKDTTMYEYPHDHTRDDDNNQKHQSIIAYPRTKRPLNSKIDGIL